MQTAKQFKEELEYLFQIPNKLERNLLDIYETNSSDDWELIDYTYEENMVGCDYKNCPRANPKNGIKEVFHVRNRKSGELLKLGSDCYFKLMYGKERLDDFEKEKIKQLIRDIKKVKKELNASIKETKQELKKHYSLLKSNIEKLENLSMKKEIAIADEKFNFTDSLSNLKRISNLLETYYNKYIREIENTFIYGRYTTQIGTVIYYVKETGEIVYNL